MFLSHRNYRRQHKSFLLLLFSKLTHKSFGFEFFLFLFLITKNTHRHTTHHIFLTKMFILSFHILKLPKMIFFCLLNSCLVFFALFISCFFLIVAVNFFLLLFIYLFRTYHTTYFVYLFNILVFFLFI